MTKELKIKTKLMYFDYNKKVKREGKLVTIPQLKKLVLNSKEVKDFPLEVVVMRVYND